MSTLFCRHCEERSNPENTAMLDCFIVTPANDKFVQQADILSLWILLRSSQLKAARNDDVSSCR